MERVLITGHSGSGKTTLATHVAARLGLPRVEMDALHHGPNWTPRPEFRADVEAFSRGARWVTEDQYGSKIGDLLWDRADTVIWLDLPRRTVMRRVVLRSLRRAATRQELWNGNRERIRDWPSPGHPMRWAWAQYDRKRREAADRIARHPHLAAVRLESARAADLWAARLT